MLENETGEGVLSSSWSNGVCERTGKTGDFPSDAVYVIPTLDKPTPEIMVCRGVHIPNHDYALSWPVLPPLALILR